MSPMGFNYTFALSSSYISDLKFTEFNSLIQSTTPQMPEFGSAGVKNCYSLKQHFIINFGFTLKMIN